MERLTMRNADGIAFWVSPQCSGGGYRMTDDKKDQARLDRLAAYEDAMPLERAQELAGPEKDGRLVVLPCKVGDLLYEIDLPEYGVITCKAMEIHTYFGPFGHARGNPMVLTATVSVEVVDGHGKGSGYTFESLDFGEKVFLTREEAEAALKKEEGDVQS